jgi:voltage-gated potassium channel
VRASSALVGQSLRDASIRDRSGALVLALRDDRGNFLTNPDPDTALEVGQVIIAIGTQDELDALVALVG